MKITSSTPLELAAPAYQKAQEEELAREITYMIEQTTKQYNNQVLRALNKGSVDKFTDAQVGNYAVVLEQLTKQLNAKILKRFSKERIDRIVTGILSKSRNANGTALYSDIERTLGIPTKQLLTQEGLSPKFNALYKETANWVETLRDEHLKAIYNNSMRMMKNGATIDSITAELGKRMDISGKKAAMIARQQVVSFNGMASNIRYRKLGITHGIWVTANDERVRHSHVDRDGKTFELAKGLYSAVDKQFLQVGSDFSCRCRLKAVIPES